MTDTLPADTVPASTLPAAALTEAFDLGRWGETVLLPAGKSQHHFLTTDRGRFVLRRSYRAKEADAVRFEHELVGHLRAHGFPGPEFVPTRSGEPSAVVDGRLWRVARFVSGTAAQADRPAHVEAVAAALARYHRLVETFTATVPVPHVERLSASLRQRLQEVVDARRRRNGAPLEADQADSLAYALAEGERVSARLAALDGELPLTLIHGGCRRGSALFDGDRLAAVIDFDSAHTEVRAYDLAVAVHDFAKIYGEPGTADFKVHLDPDVAARFVAAYHTSAPVAAAEVEAIPLILKAKRLKRALGRHARLLSGEPLSVNDHNKIVLELARVRSLSERDGLAPALSAVLR